MNSSCTITRDPQSYDDDTFDPDTGTYTRPSNDAVQVYQGKCFFTSLASFNTQAEGETDPELSLYDFYIPITTDAVQKWDLCTIDSCPEDPLAVGQKLYVVSDEFENFGVMRRIRMSRRAPAGQVDLNA